MHEWGYRINLSYRRMPNDMCVCVCVCVYIYMYIHIMYIHTFVFNRELRNRPI